MTEFSTCGGGVSPWVCDSLALLSTQERAVKDLVHEAAENDSSLFQQRRFIGRVLGDSKSRGGFSGA